MSYTMTTKERVQRMLAHKEADRIPITDNPWQGTLNRWHKEGMPQDAYYIDYFGMDDFPLLIVDNSPRYEEKIIEKTKEYTIYTTKWGVTQKSLNEADSTPEFLHHTITSPDAWRIAKERVFPSADRIPWNWLDANYKRIQEKGAWLMADLFFGFDWMHSWVCGTETILEALIEEPEWCADMFHHFLDTQLALLDMVWEKGYTFDAIRWPDDLGYKGTLFFSPSVYRQLLKPAHKKAIDWAHAHGIPAFMHSCGMVESLIPEFLDIGLDCLNPLEVKAGMDPIKIKKEYGDKLTLYGGINATLWDNVEAMEAEIKRVVPVVMENGGYICATDHSIPPAVGLKDFQYIINLMKKVGTY